MIKKPKKVQKYPYIKPKYKLKVLNLHNIIKLKELFRLKVIKSVKFNSLKINLGVICQ